MSFIFKKHSYVLATLLYLIPILSFADKFSPNASYQVCFTPKGNCTGELVNAIDNAKKTIFVQAYSFTSAPIAEALVHAKKRNIDVEVILDKSQYKINRYSSATFFKNANIPVWIDYKPAIAHNKVMIIDNHILATGSFNFTKAAQERNAENLLIIKDKELTKQYLVYFDKRKTEAEPLQEYCDRSKKC